MPFAEDLALVSPSENDLQFPELLLSTDQLVGFEEKLKAHCLAIRAWEDSVQEGNKDIEHYLKLYSLIDGLDLLQAMPASIEKNAGDAVRRITEMVIREKSSLMAEFGERIQKATKEAIETDPSKAARYSPMLEPYEVPGMRQAKALYYGKNKRHFSFKERPLKGFDKDVLQTLERLGCIDQEMVYKPSGLIKIIKAVLANKLGPSIENLSPKEKMALVEAILAHAYERPSGADELITGVARHEASQERAGKSGVVEAYIHRTKNEIEKILSERLVQGHDIHEDGWETIQFLEKYMESGSVRDYLIFTTKTSMLTLPGKPEPLNRARLKEMIEQVQEMGFLVIDVTEMTDEYFISVVHFGDELGAEPISLTGIIANKSNADQAAHMHQGVSVIRFKKEMPPGEEALRSLAHELGHLLRNLGRRRGQTIDHPHALDGLYHELPSMFFELLSLRTIEKDDPNAWKLDLRDKLHALGTARLVLFRKLCRDQVRNLNSELISEIARRDDLEPFLADRSAIAMPHHERYILGRIAAQEGLDLMDSLESPEEKKVFLYDVLRLFMNCRDRNLGEAYYELLAQWEPKKAAA